MELGQAAADYFSELNSLIKSVGDHAYSGVASSVLRGLVSGTTLALAGNGGSASTANHLAADWGMSARAVGSSSRVLSLSANPSVLTQIANDCDYQKVYSEQVRAFMADGDCLVLLSVSGQSPNLLDAAHAAKERGVTVLSLLGVSGKIAAISDDCFVLNCRDYGLVEDIHLAFGHLVTRSVLRRRSLVQTSGGHP